MPLAHQGGWDEFLVLALPVAVLMGLLWLGSRWAHARSGTSADPRDEGPERPL